jgi:hypothetical protein
MVGLGTAISALAVETRDDVQHVIDVANVTVVAVAIGILGAVNADCECVAEDRTATVASQ